MKTYKEILINSWDAIKSHKSHIGTAVAAGSVVGLGVLNPPLLGAAVAGGVASGLYLKRVHKPNTPPISQSASPQIGPSTPPANPGANPDQAANRKRRKRRIKNP